VLLVEDALRVEELVVRGRQRREVGELAHAVAHDLAAARPAPPGEEVRHVLGRQAELGAPHELEQRVLALADAHVVPEAVRHDLLGHHRRVDPTHDQGR
jgi:hypothetical protein